MPYDLIAGAFETYYPGMREAVARASVEKADFGADAVAEAQAAV